MAFAFPADGKVIVDGVNIAKRHTKPHVARPSRAASSTKDMPIEVSNVAVVCPSCGKADPCRLPLRARRHQGPHLPHVRGRSAVSDDHHDRSPCPASSSATTTRSAPSSRTRSASTTSWRSRASRRSSSTWASARRSQQQSLLEGAVARPRDHHRPEGRRHQGQEVDRRLQAPRGQRHRRQGHPPGRSHVGVLRPAHQPGDPPHPRLPRASTPGRSTATATTPSASPSS